MKTIVLDGDFTDIIIDGDLSLGIPGDGEVGIVTAMRNPYPAYTGETTITPGDEEIVLPTTLKSLLTDITINPIPSNYGKITWNGSTLLVS